MALGTVACNVADKFSKYEEYRVYKIDHEPSDEEFYFKLKKFANLEDYESRPPDVTSFLSEVSGEVLFIVCGASSAASASLVILEQIHKKCSISVLYIHPETDLLSEGKTLQERAVFHILQEYARSGALKRIYLVANHCVDPMVEDASIMGYHDSLNDVVVSSFHMINFFDHTQSITDTFSPPSETARIFTFGILNYEDSQEKIFFPLDNVRETRYYYGIPKEKLHREKDLRRKIVNQVKEKAAEQRKVSFGIYATSYEHDCALVVSNSSFIQNKEI